jgi:regulator of cell morphogenesis and NO signaling
MNTKTTNRRFVFPVNTKVAESKPPMLPSEEFSQWDIHALVDYVVRHYHLNAKSDIVEIYELAQKLFTTSCDKHPELAKLVEELFLFYDDLLFHMKKEEQILFPGITHLCDKKLHEGAFDYSTFGIVNEYSMQMREEHEDIERRFESFRQLTNNYKLPDDANLLYTSLFSKMRQFESEMMQHMQFESQFLLTKVMQLYEN